MNDYAALVSDKYAAPDLCRSVEFDSVVIPDIPIAEDIDAGHDAPQNTRMDIIGPLPEAMDGQGSESR
jgi:hypothetical protein